MLFTGVQIGGFKRMRVVGLSGIQPDFHMWVFA